MNLSRETIQWRSKSVSDRRWYRRLSSFYKVKNDQSANYHATKIYPQQLHIFITLEQKEYPYISRENLYNELGLEIYTLL